jgi:ribulose-phosphate 3-epimerase
MYSTPLPSVTGSNVIVAGTAIFGAPNPDEVIATLKATVNSAQAKISSA